MSDFSFQGSFAEFPFSGFGAKSKRTFMGTFKVKCLLTGFDEIKINKVFRELIGEVSPHMVSKDASDMAYVYSQLKYRIIECPEFWKNTDFDGSHVDENVVVEIFNKSVEAEEAFLSAQNKNLDRLRDALERGVREGVLSPRESDEEVPLTSDEENNGNDENDDGENLPEL